MTPTQRRLVAAMRQAVTERGWRWVPGRGVTVAWDSEQKCRPGRIGGWEGPYRSHVFLSLSNSPILGVSVAPWTGRRDQNITYRRAFEVLADPAGQL